MVNRRAFISRLGMGATAAWTLPRFAIGKSGPSANSRINVACVGIGHMGSAAVKSSLTENLVALCDVDWRPDPAIWGDRNPSELAASNPQAKTFSDFRVMLDKMGKDIDAVLVSTPDHTHFPIGLAAMESGKHVFIQKPLARNVWQTRTLRKAKQHYGVKTVMGNQGHTTEGIRYIKEWVDAGVIGDVREVHCWTDRPMPPWFIKPHSIPPRKLPTPDKLNWDLWQGPVSERPYSDAYVTQRWRGWWDYGTGALGDMACHIMDCGFWAMNPTAPSAVRAEQNGATDLSPPINSSITWEFPANDFSAPEGFTFHWYDGYIHAAFDESTWTLKKEREEYNHPSDEILSGVDFSKYGSVIIGDQGKLFFHRSNPAWTLHTNHRVEHFEWPTESLPRAREQNNYVEWFDAVTGKIDQGQSNFLHAGPFTETILLGVLAQRNPGVRLVWDPLNLAVKDRPDLDRFIRREYAEGWSAKQLLGLDA